MLDRKRASAEPTGDEPLPPPDHARDALAVEFSKKPGQVSPGRPPQWPFWLGVGVLAAGAWAGMAFSGAADLADPKKGMLGWLSALLLHVLSTLLMMPVVGRCVTWFSKQRAWLERLHERVVLTRAGVEFVSAYFRTFVEWSQIDGVEDNEYFISIILVKATGQVSTIPKNAFPNQAEAGRFVAAAREYFERAKAEREHAAKTTTSSPPTAAGGAGSPGADETGNPYQPPTA